MVQKGKNVNKSIEKIDQIVNNTVGEITGDSLVERTFEKCSVNAIVYEGKTYTRGDKISMKEEDFARLSKSGHKFS